MIAEASRWIAVVAGVWLIGLSLFMLVAPRRALSALGAMGGDAAIHFGELGLRIVAGAALVLAGPLSKYPSVTGPLGWFLVVSAVVLMVFPRRWHQTYSVWWARRIPVTAVRLLAPISAIAGGALVWTMS